MSTSEWVLIGIIATVALILGRLWQSADARAVGIEADRERIAAERDELATRLSRETQTRKKQAEELAAFRQRAAKTKKRAARAEKGTQDLPLGRASRMADLEGELERVERARDQSRAEREQLADQVAQLEARILVADRRPATPAPPAAPVAPPPAAGVVEESLQKGLADAREQIAKLDYVVEAAKETEARMRKRMSNQEQLYASVRSELDVKKDRLRTQEEQIQRLQAMKVVVGE